VTLLSDLVTKSWVFSLPAVSLPSWMRQDYNTGVAWSMFDRHPGFVAALTLVLIPILAAVWWKGYRLVGRWENLAFGLILGGALGNAYDRLLAICGHWPGVRDFIHVDLKHVGIDYIWPTFNIADSGISVGFVLLIILSFRPQPKTAPSAT
jgi:signal peptidase II